MSNMSYCRFENTLPDLRDCLNAIEDEEVLSESEAKCAKKMVQICKDYIQATNDFGFNEEEEDEDDGY